MKRTAKLLPAARIDKFRDMESGDTTNPAGARVAPFAASRVMQFRHVHCVV